MKRWAKAHGIAKTFDGALMWKSSGIIQYSVYIYIYIYLYVFFYMYDMYDMYDMGMGQAI